MKAEPNTHEPSSATEINQEFIEAALLKLRACSVTSQTPAILTKTRRYNSATDKIESETGGFIVEGYAKNITLNSMKEFAAFLDSANTNQALIAAQHTAASDPVKIMSRSAYYKAGEPANAITRTKDNFYRAANEQGILILDCDDYKTSKEQFLNAIKKILPLDKLAYAYTTSSSSYLSVPGKIEGRLKGQRLYIVLKDASHTTEAGENLFNRLWLEGYGWYEAGKAGQYLNRGIIDAAMFKDSCRLDFIAGSNCIEPVTQSRPPAEYNEGEPLDSRALLPKLSKAQLKELEAIQASARDRIEGEAAKNKAAYCDTKARDNLKQQGIAEPTADQLDKAKSNVLKALESSSLTGDFVITLAKDHKQLTIAEVLADPERYDQAETLDPLEPEYNNYSAVGKLYLMEGRPTLHSFAHGGKVYRLFKQSRFIQHARGSTAETTNDTLALMRLSPHYYDMGGQLVQVMNGQVNPMDEHLLTYELGSIAQYYYEKTDKEGNIKRVNIDPPKEVIKQILSMSSNDGNGNTRRGLKPLDAVITAPTITTDNHIVYKRGYDAKTRLYLSTKEDIEPPPSNPTTEQVRAAYSSLMAIINTFKLKNDIDKSVVLSAFLTAVVRPGIDKAPIYALDAPTKGSGKTYLAECIGALTLGYLPAMTPMSRSGDAEIKKTLLPKLMQGERVIIFDNLLGDFNSVSLASFITSSVYTDRVLGSSQTLNLPNKAMVMLTGNNLSLCGDLPRRCITARIDTGEENPINTKHDLTALGNLKPDAYIMQNRQRLVMDCITIIRAYLNSEAQAAKTGKAADITNTFEQWGKLARQPVKYLADIGIDPTLRDVKESIDKNIKQDAHAERLGLLVDYLYQLFGTGAFTTKQVMNAAFDWEGVPAQNNAGADLAELLTDIITSGKKPNSINVGKVLSNRVDNITAGKCIRLIETPGNKANMWRIAEVDQPTA